MRIFTDSAWLVVEYALFAALQLLLQLCGWRPNASALPWPCVCRCLLLACVHVYRMYKVRAKFGALLDIPKALLIDIAEA